MAHVPSWLLLNSLLLCSSFVAGKLVRGSEAELCEDRGSAPTWHGACLPPTQGMEALAMAQPQSRVGSKGWLPQVLIWRHFVKAHSRSSLAVLFYYMEQQVWEEDLLDKTGCRTTWLRKLLGLVTHPQRCLSSQKISSWHMRRASSASVLYPNQ